MEKKLLSPDDLVVNNVTVACLVNCDCTSVYLIKKTILTCYVPHLFYTRTAIFRFLVHKTFTQGKTQVMRLFFYSECIPLITHSCSCRVLSGNACPLNRSSMFVQSTLLMVAFTPQGRSDETPPLSAASFSSIKENCRFHRNWSKSNHGWQAESSLMNHLSGMALEIPSEVQISARAFLFLISPSFISRASPFLVVNRCSFWSMLSSVNLIFTSLSIFWLASKSEEEINGTLFF